MSRIRVVAVVVGLVALSACSGGDDQEQASPSSTSSLAEDGRPGESTNPFCAPADALGAEGLISPTDPDPAKLQEQFTRAREAVEQARAEAPEEVRADVALLADGYEEFYRALEAADFDITHLSLSDLTVLDSPEMEAASLRLDAYRAQNC